MTDEPNTNVPALMRPPQAQRSLVVRMAERFGVEPVRLMDTLKATCFKTDRPISNEQMMGLLVVAEQYHLNPFTRELFAFIDRNSGIVPFVSIDGWARIINEQPALDGLEFEWVGEGNTLACTCIIYRKDRAHPTRITEYLAECKRSTQPWTSHPRRMLRHKALVQCARIAFGFASIYDEDEAQRIITRIEPSEPVSTGAQRVRNLLRSQGVEPNVPEPLPVDEVEPDPELGAPETAAQYLRAVIEAADEETAQLALDESRSVLTDAQHNVLADAYRTRWVNTTEET